MYRTPTLALALAGFTCLVGCSESTESEATRTADSSSTTPAWLLTNAPTVAVDINQTKQSAVAGDTVTIRGVIGGRVDPLATDSAVFVMMDANLTNPCLAEDDHCSTPWDYCCTPASDKALNNATVMMVDETGEAIAENLRDYGIEPLDTVIVTGVVEPRPSDDVLIVKATGLYREN